MINWKLSLKKVKQNFQARKYLYWFSYDGISKIISINPLDHLEYEQRRRDENVQYLVGNK